MIVNQAFLSFYLHLLDISLSVEHGVKVGHLITADRVHNKHSALLGHWEKQPVQHLTATGIRDISEMSMSKNL